jgi:hypothetical protein
MSVAFSPVFPWAVLMALAGLAALVIGYGLVKRTVGLAWRTLAIAVLLAALANPVLVEEEREALADIATVLVDDSTSQDVGRRRATTEAMLERVRKAVAGMKNMELRVVRAGAPSDKSAEPVDGTYLFRALARALAQVPRKRMAGTIVLTDGQVHDVPAADGALPFAGPLHVVLTGRSNERDRRIVVENAPGYGIVGKQAEIRVRIEDPDASGQAARLTVSQDGGPPRTVAVTIGQTRAIKVKLGHAGPNIVQMEAAVGTGELTAVNNRAVVSINGVRERLRVLLVSGEPHPGERVWRNLLKADPSVDLVHFTILRPPEKQDSTPVHELSLISFPIRELFEVKIKDFDLIIFDRYRRRGVLPAIYIDNIARYVENGGAVLEAAGPEFSGAMSLFHSPLGRILPGQPTGNVIERALRARLTATGKRHTVTADLPGAGIGEEMPRWGRWFRQVGAASRRGMTLMSGVNMGPLLIVDRVGKGRVAQLLSDQIWLWARGYDGGGPHSELLRRLAHWLMKEPDLEENSLRARMEGNRLAVVRRSVEIDTAPVEIISPSGRTVSVTLKEGIGGRAKALVPVGETGIYRVRDRRHTTLAAVGKLNPREFADMRTTAARLKPLAAATGGGVFWSEDGLPEIRRVRPGRLTASRSWLGLVENRDYKVTSVREAPLLPALAVLLVGLGALLLAWRREGR